MSIVAGLRTMEVTSEWRVLDPDAKEPSPGARAAAPAEPGRPLALGDAIGDSIGSAASISAGDSVSSLIDTAGDLDYFRITVQAGQSYVFSLNGASIPGGIPDTYLELRDSTGALVAENDDGGILTDSVLMFRAPTAGDYYIVARGWSSTQTGNYTLSVQAIETGSTSPTDFQDTGLPEFSWTEAAYQLTRSGSTWAGAFAEAVTITYAFRSTAPTTMPDDTSGFSRFSSVQIQAAEAALAAWAAVANINFVRVGSGSSGDGAYSDSATILFGNYSSGVDGAAAFAYLPSSNFGGNTAAGAADGDVWINSSLSSNAALAPGEYGLHTLLHEIGHALGLSHPSDYDAGDGGSFSYDVDASYHEDTRLFTVMSYFGTLALPDAGWATFATTPQMHDIAAIQRLYGRNTSTRSGDTVYGFNSTSLEPESTITSASQSSGFTIWDGSGYDTLDLSGYTTDSRIDLRQEAFSSAGPGPVAGSALLNIAIARGVVIEEAIGGLGNDTIIGNDAGNRLEGGAGNDWLAGGAGDDMLVAGQQGVDVLVGGSGFDTADFSHLSGGVYLDVGAGAYAASGVWTAFLEIEAFAGGDGADTLFGSASSETLIGGGGGDTLIGRAGVDLLLGGQGDDWLDGGSGDDILEGGSGINVLIGGEGVDLASYAASQTGLWINLSAGVYSAAGVWDVFFESIDGALGGAGADTIFGSTGNETLRGGAGDDSLIGLEGNDVLDGGDGQDWLVGGAGNDRLTGGAGVDVYTGGSGADVFDLGVAAGWDVAFDFNAAQDRFDLGGLFWLGFLTIDADGDGLVDDTLLGYAGGNFVALDVTGLTLDQWNALVGGP